MKVTGVGVTCVTCGASQGSILNSLELGDIGITGYRRLDLVGILGRVNCLCGDK